MRLIVSTELELMTTGNVSGKTELDLGGHILKYDILAKNETAKISRSNLRFIFGGEFTFKTPEERILARVYGECLFGLIQKASNRNEYAVKSKNILTARSESEEKDFRLMFAQKMIEDWENDTNLPSFRV